jgi:hypothetical protein
MRIEEIRGNLKTMKEQRDAIIIRLDKLDKRMMELENKLSQLDK